MITIDQADFDVTYDYLLSAAGADAIKMWMRSKWKMALGFQTQEVWS